MAMWEVLIGYAVLSYIVVGINWVRADYHPKAWRLAGAFVWWPGWLIGRVRHHFRNDDRTNDSTDATVA
jgi:hypothetical protein